MLDKISKKILMELQSDGRISNVELAARVNLSPAACLERVRKLHESGYIMGYTAQLNPQLLDVSLLVFIEVVLDRTTPEVFDKIIAVNLRAPMLIIQAALPNLKRSRGAVLTSVRLTVTAASRTSWRTALRRAAS